MINQVIKNDNASGGKLFPELAERKLFVDHYGVWDRPEPWDRPFA
jgi:hypothetical protein